MEIPMLPFVLFMADFASALLIALFFKPF